MIQPTNGTPLGADLILDNLKDYAIFAVNPDGLISSWNVGVQRVLGYEEEEFLGLPISDIFVPEDREAGVVEHELRGAATGRVEDERWHRRKDGNRIWVHGIMAGLFDEAGNLCGYAKIMRDYTDRRRAEEARRKSETRYRLLLETIEDYAIVVLDLQGQIVSWNPGVADVFGYQEAEFVGQPSAILFTPRERAESAPLKERERTTREGRISEERWLVHKDGHEIWVSSMMCALRDEADEIQGFVKIVRDETARKRAEEERERLLRELSDLNEALERRVEERTAALQSSEARFSTAVSASPVPMLIIRRSDRAILEANDSFLRLIGFAGVDVMGRTADELRLFGPVDRRGSLPQGIWSGDALHPTELSVRARGGKTRFALATGEAVAFQGSESLLLTLIDITERMRTEEELRQAVDAVVRGSDWLADAVMERLAQQGPARADRVAIAELTRRERQVLGLLATGLTNEQIGAELGIARQTVDNYVSRVYDKIGVKSRTQAVVWARERGVVGVDRRQAD